MPPTPECTQAGAEATPPVDVPAIMREMRRRARRRRSEKAELQRLAEQVVSTTLAMALKDLDARLQELRRSVQSVGAMPPLPPTVRGRVGAILVGLVRRSLFWLIPALRSSHAGMLGALEAQYRALVEITVALRDINARLVVVQAATSTRPGAPQRDSE